MSENKERIGKLAIEGSGVEYEFVSTLAGRFVEGRRVNVSKTVIDTYVIGIRRENVMGEVLDEQMHLTKKSLSAILSAIHLFLEHEKEDVAAFSRLALDEESGFLYKTLDDLKEDAE